MTKLQKKDALEKGMYMGLFEIVKCWMAVQFMSVTSVIGVACALRLAEFRNGIHQFKADWKLAWNEETMQRKADCLAVGTLIDRWFENRMKAMARFSTKLVESVKWSIWNVKFYGIGIVRVLAVLPVTIVAFAIDRIVSAIRLYNATYDRNVHYSSPAVLERVKFFVWRRVGRMNYWTGRVLAVCDRSCVKSADWLLEVGPRINNYYTFHGEVVDINRTSERGATEVRQESLSDIGKKLYQRERLMVISSPPDFSGMASVMTQTQEGDPLHDAEMQRLYAEWHESHPREVVQI